MTDLIQLVTLVIMIMAPVAQLKARLSAYLRRLKGGEEILITDRGVPVAKIVPLSANDRNSPIRDRLVRTGLVRQGSGKLGPLLRPPRGQKKDGRSVLEALLEERKQGR